MNQQGTIFEKQSVDKNSKSVSVGSVITQTTNLRIVIVDCHGDDTSLRSHDT